MFSFIFKHTLLVCIGFLCLFSSPATQAEPFNFVPKVNTAQPILYHGDNDIIVTITGLEILIQSDQGDNIILAADLYNSTQQVVRSKRVSTPTNSISLDISGLSSGYYIVKVATTTDIENIQLYIP